VSHPNIAAVYEVDEDGGQIFIVMELVEGRTLRRKLVAEEMPLGEATRLAIQIARGMARAYEKGVLHRDLKPDNVMVGPDGEVKILDQRGRARALFASEAEALAAVRKVLADLTVKSFSQTVQLTWDIADVYGVSWRGRLVLEDHHRRGRARGGSDLVPSTRAAAEDPRRNDQAMSEFQRRCRECGKGYVKPLARAGRFARYKTFPRLEIPAHVEIPTCDRCSAEW
jgi:tRNA A-37 threonylcarbamoyl transferase component Bud32